MPTKNHLEELSQFAEMAEQRNQGRADFWSAYGRAAKPAGLPGKRVGDLLGTVLALSARTRRMVQPRAIVELDVFAPGGRRALHVFQGDLDE
ncbi:MAG: hypothetical protein KDJ19_13145 [Hyphomicrobiaceae bacterium]|nr:hypothetical protein [Hyphomicrobiaceae bacterium]MCC0023618.1 hypothetical protein [Hyphomicrobiaceae bacterium]